MPQSQPFVDVEFENSKSKTLFKTKALLDTGAQMTCLPSSLIEQLELNPVGKVQVQTVGGSLVLSNYVCDFRVKTLLFKNVFISEVNTPFPLLGWDILGRHFHEIAADIVVTNQLINIVAHLTTIKAKAVLILGQDSDQIYRLRKIQNRLLFKGYEGILPKDVTDIEIQSTEEKVNMLASVSKFIICDNTVPSGHIDELKICAINRFVTAIIQEKGRGATWMQIDYEIDHSFIKSFEYSSIEAADSVIDEAIQWAESKVQERKERFNKIYKWRTPSNSSGVPN